MKLADNIQERPYQLFLSQIKYEASCKSEAEIATLAKCMKNLGCNLMLPVVTPITDELYQVVTHPEVVEAAKAAGLDEIWVFITTQQPSVIIEHCELLTNPTPDGSSSEPIAKEVTPAATDNGVVTQKNYANKQHEAGLIAEYQATKDTILIKIRELNRIIKANKFGGAKFVQAKLDKIEWQGRLDSINNDLAWAKQAKKELKHLEKQATAKPTIEITTQGEITESDVNFTDGEWDTTPTPDYETYELLIPMDLVYIVDINTFNGVSWKQRKTLAKEIDKAGRFSVLPVIKKMSDGIEVVAHHEYFGAAMMADYQGIWCEMLCELGKKPYVPLQFEITREIENFWDSDYESWAAKYEQSLDAAMDTERVTPQCEAYEAEQSEVIAKLPKKHVQKPPFELLQEKQPKLKPKYRVTKKVNATVPLFDLPNPTAAELRKLNQPVRLNLKPAPLFRKEEV